MLNAGFRFICCHSDEEEEDQANVNWRKNLLEKVPLEEMELLKGRQANLMQQDNSFDLGRANTVGREEPTKHRRYKSAGNHLIETVTSARNKETPTRRTEVIHYLSKAKAQGINVLELYYQRSVG